MYIFGGYAILGLACIAIGCMMYLSWQVVLDSMKKEEKRKNELLIMRRADQLYRTYVQNAEYKVTLQPIRITNESDIDWGDKEELLL